MRSLKIWDRVGIIPREISLYKKLKKKQVDITFLTFGKDDDLNYSKLLNGIKIIPCKRYFNSRNSKVSFLQSLILPLKIKKTFKCIIYSNKFHGDWTIFRNDSS